MSDNNFFNKQDNMQPQGQQAQADDQDQSQAPETIALGDKQYTQEDLQRLVNLGEVASEMEEKWNRKVDDLYPEFTRRSQELSETKEQLKEIQTKLDAQVQVKAQAGQEMSEEEQARYVKEQAKKFGIVTDDTFEERYQTRREQERNEQLANSLIEESTTYVQKQVSEGKPGISTKDLVDYMDENGILSYEAAYKLKFEKELDDWKMKNLSAGKPSPMYTSVSSNAGGKQPEERKVTTENLAAVIQETMNRFQ